MSNRRQRNVAQPPLGPGLGLLQRPIPKAPPFGRGYLLLIALTEFTEKFYAS